MDPLDVTREGPQDIIPKKRLTRGPNPTVRTVSKTEEARWKWFKPLEKFTAGDNMRVLVNLVEVIVEEILSEHFYNWSDAIKKQSEGRAIGLPATGSIFLMKKYVADVLGEI